MTVLQNLSVEPLFSSQTIVYCLRILIALGCGGAIGSLRNRYYKETGANLMVFVCGGAALMMIISKYGFLDVSLPDSPLYPGSRGADPARVAAQVVSGVSFLGAGVIFKREGGMVRGLTSAAGIWVAAAVGLGIGAGNRWTSLFTTLVICVLQIAMHRFSFGADSYVTNLLHFTVKNGHEFLQSLNRQLELWDATVLESSFDRHQEDGTTDYDLSVRRKKDISYAELKAFIEQHEEILACTNHDARGV